jgi:hypothetical protein
VPFGLALAIVAGLALGSVVADVFSQKHGLVGFRIKREQHPAAVVKEDVGKPRFVSLGRRAVTVKNLPEKRQGYVDFPVINAYEFAGVYVVLTNAVLDFQFPFSTRKQGERIGADWIRQHSKTLLNEVVVRRVDWYPIYARVKADFRGYGFPDIPERAGKSNQPKVVPGERVTIQHEFGSDPRALISLKLPSHPLSVCVGGLLAFFVCLLGVFIGRQHGTPNEYRSYQVESSYDQRPVGGIQGVKPQAKAFRAGEWCQGWRRLLAGGVLLVGGFGGVALGWSIVLHGHDVPTGMPCLLIGCVVFGRGFQLLLTSGQQSE